MWDRLKDVWKRLVAWDTRMIQRVFPRLSSRQVRVYQRIAPRLAVVAVALILLALPVIVWGPGPFMMGWWHLRHDADVSWQVLEIDVPRPWFVLESKTHDTQLAIVRSPDLGHLVVFGPHPPELERYVRSFDSTTALIEHMETDGRGLVTLDAIDGQQVVRQVLVEPPPDTEMEHWILPDLGYDFMYSRQAGEASLFHELTCVMRLDADRAHAAQRR